MKYLKTFENKENLIEIDVNEILVRMRKNRKKYWHLQYLPSKKDPFLDIEDVDSEFMYKELELLNGKVVQFKTTNERGCVVALKGYVNNIAYNTNIDPDDSSEKYELMICLSSDDWNMVDISYPIIIYIMESDAQKFGL